MRKIFLVALLCASAAGAKVKYNVQILQAPSVDMAYLVDAEFFLIGEGVFLLPHVGLSVACAADALSGES